MKLKQFLFLLGVLVLSGIVFWAFHAFFTIADLQKFNTDINEKATSLASSASDRLTPQIPTKTVRPNKKRSIDEDSVQKFTKNEITLSEDLLAKGYTLTTITVR